MIDDTNNFLFSASIVLLYFKQSQSARPSSALFEPSHFCNAPSHRLQRSGFLGVTIFIGIEDPSMPFQLTLTRTVKCYCCLNLKHMMAGHNE